MNQVKEEFDDYLSKKICMLNDEFRKNPIATWGKLLCTRGFSELPTEIQKAVFQKVQTFDDFTPDNDPYWEHDFIAVEFWGLKFYAKIDYWDSDLTAWSDDPSDPEHCTRVMTIMISDEY